MSKAYAEKRVWIIGASSGIGEALAARLAGDGAQLVLSARSEDKLIRLRDSLAGEHHALPLDVADAKAVQEAAKTVQQRFGQIDSVIFLAALYQPMDLEALDIETVAAMLHVNVLGAFHVVQAVLPILQQQQRGQLALCGSVAGYAGLPHGQPYSATKAAVRSLAQSLKAEMANYPQVDIKLISPGFVKTPLTDKNSFDMPCIIEPEQAAAAIAEGLLGNAFEVHFPKRFTWVMKLLALLPYPLYFLCMKKAL